MVNKINRVLMFVELTTGEVGRGQIMQGLCSHVKKEKVYLDFVLNVLRNPWWVVSRRMT